MRHLVSGLVVETDIDSVHGSAVPDGAATDLTIAHAGERPVGRNIGHGKLLQCVFSRRGPMYSTVRTPQGDVLLRLHGRADFEIAADHRSVRAFSDPTSAPEMLGLLATGNLLATVLALRGETALHASAVALRDRAVAFVAHSGTGKSTLAALACARGTGFVTDDLLRPRISGDGTVYCWQGVPENRLRRDAAELLGSHRATQIRTSVDGRSVWRPAPSTHSTCQLAAIVLPRPERSRNHLSLRELAPGEAVLELTRRPRILGWMDETIRAQTFANLSTIARAVPVYQADIPWGPPFEPSMTDGLLELTRQRRPRPAA